MEISLSNILNEIVEEMTQDKTLTEGEDPSVSPEEVAAAAQAEEDAKDAAPAEETSDADDEELLNKLASIFTPEEAAALADKLESGEISEDDIISYITSAGQQQAVSESYTPTLPIMLAIGAGARAYRGGV